ncbi:hypothetical protein DSCO28_71180 [Desulfosarcina ovata subsp. sediminis]|uniref:PEP-CTERM protein-sorting domain-containing protein n=1 Tax=Desulfosarcina ovata subsp. sediminis TaxID=885957 RepID=A0A5K8A1Y1_9BACT|nr:VPLPA-CTERM sorting domain-containing protein [Desulfosarcina ovata]BBO86552.1 hypothetical protein DSCO28_71180 [Desulfosarcina ovata subsp. sediminis]
MKTVKLVIAVLSMLFLATSAYAYTWSDVDLEGIYGTGENEALVVVDFSGDDDDSFAWKVCFDSATYRTILDVISSNDSDFTLNSDAFVTWIAYTDEAGNEYYGSGNWFSYFSSNDLGETWSGWHMSVADGEAVGWSRTGSAPVTPLASAVPVPGAVWLLGSGVMILAGLRRKRQA